MKTYVFHVEGMHCSSCSMVIESELSEVSEVEKVRASLVDRRVEIFGDFGDREPDHVAKDLTKILKPHGYSLSTIKNKHLIRWKDFRLALPLAAGLVTLFVFLQKSGWVNLSVSSELNYGAAFVIGLVASVSTCMAVVGGLTLSLSANFAKQGDKIRPQIFLHLGRFFSFLVLGGVIGSLGSVFQLKTSSFLVLNIFIAIILFVLGFNLLDIFPWAKKLQLTVPGFIGRRALNLKNINHVLMPFIVGAATFFLPCGFTQSMQIYTLTTGSFIVGSLTMFSFVLGTFPVLALLSFTSLGIHKVQESSIFFKTAGLVVVFFAFFNLANALATTGIIPPLFNF
ncbi:MAG: hypothetical protein A2418_03545 [Candidatus Brennerbacteria bacterium RIFOXYC1_FULL_41_11]|uniref:HMA domain-containing protein n=1 Tax=Candidatus Brennerbacteria bacterium RIFOXYD1_FULL_41_16 TaxID=1797529 RepID=A0A1G1XKP9_9BACT|nr:MAG: hypothetical protein A2391_00605 [Candidatus Brennerbacteria bacterium RIFOXYB1_FULL_41_13]OGY38914.1 MAG: hypothetical protein A2418_03545 [Candidatus Brennerbacteria bacterium RIFOXYC1_FULL_41_11]OGY40532.1 MAG: hypothetical protein A2570_02200 [Candidatus Brennerbacteria bacterium RIFOXYD1_FULL_41_16]